MSKSWEGSADVMFRTFFRKITKQLLERQAFEVQFFSKHLVLCLTKVNVVRALHLSLPGKAIWHRHVTLMVDVIVSSTTPEQCCFKCCCYCYTLQHEQCYLNICRYLTRTLLEKFFWARVSNIWQGPFSACSCI